MSYRNSSGVIKINRHIHIELYAILSIAALLIFTEITIDAWASANTQELQQQILPERTQENFTLKVDILGVNSATRNSTISITGSQNNPLTSNMTIDLYSKVQQEFATGGTPIALTIPVTINSNLVHEGDEIRVCLTMTDTGKVDCESTVITSYNIEGFPKSVPLEAGGSIGQQIEEITK
jgi:hypothetical protein